MTACLLYVRVCRPDCGSLDISDDLYLNNLLVYGTKSPGLGGHRTSFVSVYDGVCMVGFSAHGDNSALD